MAIGFGMKYYNRKWHEEQENRCEKNWESSIYWIVMIHYYPLSTCEIQDFKPLIQRHCLRIVVQPSNKTRSHKSGILTHSLGTDLDVIINAIAQLYSKNINRIFSNQ